jgi:hypothetical protein
MSFCRDARPAPHAADFSAFLKLPKHEAPPIRGPGLISAVYINGKRRTVAKMIADGKRMFEEANR